MNTHNLLRAFRNFEKDKFFASLKILGLALGLAVFMLVMQYVRFETSYEDFVPDRSLIYRVRLDSYVNNELVVSSAENYPAVGPALAAFPEVSGYSRLYNLGYKNNVVITNDDAKPQPVSAKQRKFLYADSAFLPMMGYHLALGDVRTALADPNTAVITRECAALYFGNENPIGKILHMQDDDNNNELARVTGVTDESPANTHLKFDVLFSYKTLFLRQGKRPGYAMNRYDQTWNRNDMYTFIRLQPGADYRALEGKFPSVIEKHNLSMKAINQRDVISLQPLSGIHLTSHLAEEPENNGDTNIVRFLELIGFFVLAIAWINYVNLTTAKAVDQAKEVGVRKVMGAFRFQLIKQFLTEAAVINLSAVILAYALAGAVIPAFNALSGLSLTIADFLQPWFLEVVVLLWITGTLLSGFYPAVVLSSFKPGQVLKGKLRSTGRGILLRKALVVSQFVASVALIAGTLIVFNQLQYMMHANLGMNLEQVVVLERPGIGPHRSGFNAAIESFRNDLKMNSSIKAVATSYTIPGRQRENKTIIKKYGATEDQVITVRANSMDYEFMDVFQMKVLAGRIFSEEFANVQDTSVVITESAARLLGFKSPAEAIGQTLTFTEWGWSPIVVGVVNDYHQVSLKNALEPTVFYGDQFEGEFYSIRMATTDIPGTLEHIRVAWQKAFPGNPFDYFFLDDYFNRQYKNEDQFGKLFTTFAALALVIGCLGLLGLSAYTAAQRTKEIGIRKVLGSTEVKLFMLLSRDYLKLITLAIVLAVPLVYAVMDRWIQSFPYRTTITGNVFVVAGATVLFISLLTVSVQTWRAARANPVDALRYE